MTDDDKIINPQHFGSDPANIRIRSRINQENFELHSNLGSLLVEIRHLGGVLRSPNTI